MWMNYMANKYDYLIYTVDGRGSENRGKDFEQVIFRQLGEVEMDDQFLGVDYLKSLPYVDSNRLAVHGWSYGGFMTTSLMMKRPGTFKVGVAGGPVIDWKYYEIMYTERYMDRPQDNPEGYTKASLLDKVDSLSGDLMIIHGSIDDVVVPQHSIDMLKKSVEAGVQLDFFLYPMHPHNVRGRDRIHLMEKVITYITEKMEKHAPAEVLPVEEKASEATNEVDQEPSKSSIKKTEPKKD
jgi:dipeptidyl-peptidase-4